MSLIRQIWILLLVTLFVAFIGSFVVWMVSSQEYLETQLRLKNADNAQALALSLSQQKADMTLIEVVVSAQFDTGFYQKIQFTDPSGRKTIEHVNPSHASITHAPAWFVKILPIKSIPGTAEVTDGWRVLGSVEIISHTGFAYDQLWSGSIQTASLLLLLAFLSGAVAWQGVKQIRKPLKAVIGQANALMERRFITVSEPSTPDLANVTNAMNAMVVRLKASFDDQATQVEQLRRQAHCDALTGLSRRDHFMAHLQSVLFSEDGPSTGILYLIRVVDLGGINRSLGYRQADDLLKNLAASMNELTQNMSHVYLGRLNGGDFAIFLSDNGQENDASTLHVDHVSDMIKRLFAKHASLGQAVVGATRWLRGFSVSQVMVAADIALAKAESQGKFAAVMSDSNLPQTLAVGEDEWRKRLEFALQHERLRLVQYPVLDANGKLVHQECPMRIQWVNDGEYASAAQWLHMAKRCGLLAKIDEQALRLALAGIQADGIPRGVNLSATSLQDVDFLHCLDEILQSHSKEAKMLWLEVSEEAALMHFDCVKRLCEKFRPIGVKVGLEHAGEHLARIEALFESGLDYIKLDGAMIQGLSDDSDRMAFVSASVRMMHNLGLQVFAEGVSNEKDLLALWQCGADGATGPAVKLAFS